MVKKFNKVLVFPVLVALGLVMVLTSGAMALACYVIDSGTVELTIDNCTVCSHPFTIEWDENWAGDDHTWALGSMCPGDSQCSKVKITNACDSDRDVRAYTNDICKDVGVGLMVDDKSVLVGDNITVPAGSTIEVEVCVTVGPSAEPGSCKFTLDFCEAPED